MTLILVLLGQLVEPEWTKVPPIQTTLPEGSLGDVLHDIESHMPAGHIYRSADKVNWAHETTHGINSRLRTKPGTNAFYVLNDRAVVVTEPKSTLQKVAEAVPPSLRGKAYQTYFYGPYSKSGGTYATYVLDEWSAYTNGTETLLELCQNKLWPDNLSRLTSANHMMEFCVYSMVLITTVPDPDPKMVSFVEWNLDRCMNLFDRSLMDERITEPHTMGYWRGFMLNPDAKDLRIKIRNLYPELWLKRFELGEEPKAPPVSRRLLYITGISCAACNVFNNIDVPKLKELGYKFGKHEDKCHIEKIDDSKESRDNWEKICEKYEIDTIPTLVLIEDGKNAVVVQSTDNKRVMWQDAIRMFNHGYHGYPVIDSQSDCSKAE